MKGTATHLRTQNPVLSEELCPLMMPSLSKYHQAQANEDAMRSPGNISYESTIA